MKEIADEFRMTVEQTEHDLCKLITTGKINFKINSRDQTIHRKVVNQKTKTLRMIEAKTEQYLHDTQTMLFKVKLNQVNLNLNE